MDIYMWVTHTIIITIHHHLSNVKLSKVILFIPPIDATISSHDHFSPIATTTPLEELLGSNFVIDTKKSPYLKDSRNPGDWHNLQAMLHVVAGWNGKKGEFKLMVKRSIALVNKSCEFLKDECLVPGSWWVEKNKGMIKEENGEWVIAPVDEEPELEF